MTDQPTLEPEPLEPEPIKPLGAIIALLALAAVALLSGLILLAARAIINIGGYCAEGGPYVIAQQCPQGTATILGLGIPLMIGLIFVYIVAKPSPWPTLIFWFWPIIFIGLGLAFIVGAFAAPNGLSIAGLLVGMMMIVFGIVPVIITRSQQPLKEVIKDKLVSGFWPQLIALIAGFLVTLPAWLLLS